MIEGPELLVPFIGSLLIFAVALISYRVMRAVVFPPCLYACLWSLLLLLLGLSGRTYYPLRLESMLLFVSACLFFTLGGFVAVGVHGCTHSCSGVRPFVPRISDVRRRFLNRCIDVMILLQLVLSPLYVREMLRQATSLSDSGIAAGLRLTGMIERSDPIGGILGFFDYFSFTAKTCAFIAVALVDESRSSKRRALIATVVPLLYSLIALERTSTMYLVVGALGIWLLRYRLPSARIVIPFAVLCGVLFAVPAILLHKGVEADSSGLQAMSQLMGSITHYAVSPLVAFDLVVASPSAFERTGSGYIDFFAAVAYRFGLSTDPPPSPIAPYEFTPAPTNVYPIYLNWLLDFGFWGLAIGMIILGWFCTLIYLWARARRPIPTVLFGLVVCGIGTTFMGDGFLVSISAWLQAVLVGLFLLKMPLRGSAGRFMFEH